MTAGRGWIALALVVFASWMPWRLVIGALSVRRHLDRPAASPGGPQRPAGLARAARPVLDGAALSCDDPGARRDLGVQEAGRCGAGLARDAVRPGSIDLRRPGGPAASLDIVRIPRPHVKGNAYEETFWRSRRLPRWRLDSARRDGRRPPTSSRSASSMSARSAISATPTSTTRAARRWRRRSATRSRRRSSKTSPKAPMPSASSRASPAAATS